jgi:hypothetical protein
MIMSWRAVGRWAVRVCGWPSTSLSESLFNSRFLLLQASTREEATNNGGKVSVLKTSRKYIYIYT